MTLEEAMQPGNEKHMVDLCQRCINLENVYSHGKKPEIFVISQKLGITYDEYRQLKEFIRDGGYNEMINNKISNDFDMGASVLE